MAAAPSPKKKLSAKAQFCDDFDNNVIIAGKLDMASKYLTDDFKEHTVRLTANGLPEFLEKMKAMRPAMAARPAGAGGGRPPGAPRDRTVLSEGELVVFMSANPERDDPANSAKQLPASTHFDVYKLRGQDLGTLGLSAQVLLEDSGG